jgi:hypothetical protein
LRAPLIAKAQVDIARKEKADTVAHGATGKGNDQCRFELTYMALAPQLQIIAPWKIEAYRDLFPGRAEMIAYCAKHRIPVEASLKKPYSMDPQPPSHLLRGRHPRGSVVRSDDEGEQGDVQALRRPRGRAGQARVCRNRLREGQCRRRERAEAHAPAACSRP